MVDPCTRARSPAAGRRGLDRIDGLGERRAASRRTSSRSCTARIFAMQGWLARQLDIDADVDAAGGNPSRLIVQARQLGRGEPLIDRLQVTGTGLATDHRIALDVTGFPPQPQLGAPHAVMEIAGRYDKEVWNATVTTTELSTGAANQQLKIPEPATVLASRDRAQLDNFCLVIGAGRMCAEGKWQRGGAWQGTVSGYEIPLASVLPPSGAEAEIRRTHRRSRACVRRRRASRGRAKPARASSTRRSSTVRPARSRRRSISAPAVSPPPRRLERIEFSFGIQAFTDTFLYASARLQRDGRNDIMNLPLTGDMRARAADANILPLVFPEIDQRRRPADGECDDRRHAGAAGDQRPHRAGERRVRFLSRQPRAARAERGRRPGEQRAATSAARRARATDSWKPTAASRGAAARPAASCTCAGRICWSRICPSIASSPRPTCASRSMASAWMSRAT